LPKTRVNSGSMAPLAAAATDPTPIKILSVRSAYLHNFRVFELSKNVTSYSHSIIIKI
jgi:hypothetical protein